jgi:effector-binding domain-containing protein
MFMSYRARSGELGRYLIIRPLGGIALAAALALGLVQFSAIAQTPVQPPAQGPALAPPAPIDDAFGEEVTLTAKPIVFLSGKATWEKAFPTLTEKFKAISAFLDKQNLKPAGSMMTVYTAVNDKGFEFQAAVPLAEAPANLPRGALTVGQSPAGKALKFVYRGSYDSMDMLYESIVHYLDGQRIERQGLFVEEYLTDPVTTPEDKLVVNVFVLVK